MRFHFVTVSVMHPEAAEAELNRFLASHRVEAVDRRLVDAGAYSVWTICVAYAEGDAAQRESRAGRVDYREILSSEQFAVFARLRALRKTLAEKEAVPPYAIFTNEQLAAMVERRVGSVEALKTIAGVGKARVDKYGRAFLEILQAAVREPVTGDEPEGSRDAD